MAGRGKGPFRIAIEDFFETFDFGKILFGWWVDGVEKLETEGLDLYNRLAEKTGLGKYLPPGLTPDEIKGAYKVAPVQIVPILLGIGMMVVGATFGAFTPIVKIGMYRVDREVRSGRPSPMEAWAMAFRQNPDGADVSLTLEELGFKDEFIEGYKKLAQPLLSAFEYQVLWRRKQIDDTEFLTKLKSMGLEEDTINAVINLGRIIPGPADLVTMAVREAFDPEIVAKFGYLENFPHEFGVWSERQGLSKDWAEKYWAMHWQLPSSNQVFEMFQRLRPGVSDVPVDDDTMDEYLRIADFAPFWRERMKEISYNPLTRVDVRRMYKTGNLDVGQVKSAYLDLGYSDKNADLMTEFTIAYATEEETGVVRSSVLRAYSSGQIARGDAEQMLTDGGYDEISIAFYLDAIDFDEAMDINDLKLKNIKKRYVEGLIDETTVNGEIGQLNLPSERVLVMLELWNTERASKTTLPTASQTEKFYEMGIITVDEFTHVYELRGYDEETINWTLARIDIEAQAASQKEAERSLNDLEKIDKAATSSQYQKDRAVVDLLIAQAKAEMTDIRVEIKADITDQVKQSLNDRLDEIKQFIALANTHKAQLRVDLKTVKLLKG